MRLRERRGCYVCVSGGRAGPRRLRLRLQAALKEATRKMTLCQRLLERDKTLAFTASKNPGHSHISFQTLVFKKISSPQKEILIEAVASC